MIKKITFKIKALAYFFAFFIIGGQIVKAQCPIINQPPTASPTSICGSGTATISIPSSEVGVTYAVGSGTTIISGPTAGTGQPMTFTIGPISNTTTYIVGATNGTCTITMTPMVTVTVNPIPTVVITPSHTAICKGAIDTLTASGAVNYTWTPGGSTASSLTVSPNSSTSYTLMGVDANGCSNTATQAITVNNLPTINITNSTFGGICPGGSATLTASGGTTYTWSANAGSATTNTVIVSPTVTTSYTVIGTNTVTGCSNTKTRNVTVNPSATVTINGPAFVCMGSVATLTASGAASYTWSTGTSGATTSVSPTVTTTYSVVSGSGGGTCPGTASFTLTVSPNPSPTITISGSSSICNGQTDLLTASGANTYTWSNNAGSATTATVSPSPTTNTTYTVTGTDANGCTNVSTLSVTVNPLPNVTTSGTKVICIGNTTTLTANGASTYTWNTSATTNTVSLSPTANTTYSVIGTDVNGCSKQAVTTVTVNALPTLTITPQTICTGSTGTLTASGASTYTWSPGLSSTNGATVTGSPTVTTNYTVSGTNTNGCVGVDTISIFVVSSLNVTASSSSSVTCAGNSVTLTGLGASSYSWTAGGGTISGGTGTTVTVTPTGPSTSYTVNGSSGTCTTTPYVISVNVNILPTVTASVSPNDTICTGSMATLTGGGAVTYSWTNGVTDGTAFTPSVTATYTVTGTDANGCNATATQKITLNPLPAVNFSTGGASGGICPGVSATLTPSGAVTYTWTNTGATGSGAIVVTPSVTTTYTLVGTDAIGCSNSRVRTIPLKPVPTVTVSAPAGLCSGQTATLTATSTGTVTVGTYSWTTGATTASTTDTPTLTTTYTLYVTATGPGACTDTVRTTINVGALPSLTITATHNPICAGLRDTLTVSGATTYTWHPTGSNLTTINGVLNSTKTFTVIGSNTGCSDSTTITINVNPSPTVTIVSNPTNDTICSGSPVTLTGMGANNYVWSGGITNGTAFSPTVTATYTVVGTSANNCSKASSVQVVVNNCSSGIAQHSNNDRITVYPNPSNGNFSISVVNFENTSVEVYNSLGEKIYAKTLNANTENINIEKFNAGVYFMHVKQKGVYTYKNNIVLTK
jgi:hypothetical protein